MTNDTKWTLSVEVFRSLREVEWSPDGVCLVAGPNGSGKTTLLAALKLLRDTYLRGLLPAIGFARGAARLRHRHAETGDPVVLSLEARGVHWTLVIPVEGDGINPYFGEAVSHGGKAYVNIPLYEPTFRLEGDKDLRSRGDKPGIETLMIRDQPGWLAPFLDFVRNIRVYDVYNLEAVGGQQPGDEGDLFLQSTGRNLTAVLQNWHKAARRFRGQFAWVLAQMKGAFPELVADIEFEPDGRLMVYPPDSVSAEDKIPLNLMAAGFVTGLLHLTAVAGAADGSIVAIDEMENQLHPHAIRSLLASMRELAEKRGLTVILTTHSPVVMNAFKGDEEHFYVLDRDATRPQPRMLTEVRDPDWLAHFMLGSLYERGLIAPQIPTTGE